MSVTNNKLSYREINKISFIITLKIIKCLDINLIKQVKDMYTEKYKTLVKEIEKDKNRKIIYAFVLKGLVLLKYSNATQRIYRFNVILIRIPIVQFYK